MAADVSIVVVNFNTAAFLGALLDSIQKQEFLVGGRPGQIEVIIVDNASRGEDSFVIQGFTADPRVKWVQNRGNHGYAQANNQGYHVATGLYHMVLNPDTLMRPGCLAALVGHLESNLDTAMVGPMAFMDADCTVMMPPNELPTPEWFELQMQSQVDLEAARRNLERRTDFSYPYWTTAEPLTMEMLSGCCVMFRRELYAASFPFDPGYPLYYEDTDMFMALSRRGRTLKHIPNAHIVHYFSRSAFTHAKGAQFRHKLSEDRYFAKFFPGEGYERFKAAKATLDAHIALGKAPPSLYDFQMVRAGSKPPEFYVDARHKNYYAEISGNPIFTLAAAFQPKEEGWFTTSQSMWDGLGNGTYWARIVSHETRKPLQAWIIEKVTAY